MLGLGGVRGGERGGVGREREVCHEVVICNGGLARLLATSLDTLGKHSRRGTPHWPVATLIIIVLASASRSSRLQPGLLDPVRSSHTRLTNPVCAPSRTTALILACCVRWLPQPPSDLRRWPSSLPQQHLLSASSASQHSVHSFGFHSRHCQYRPRWPAQAQNGHGFWLGGSIFAHSKICSYFLALPHTRIASARVVD